jgi:hypothetical protein
VLARRTLEAIRKQQRATAGSLYQQLDRLLKSASIPPLLADIAHLGQQIGNLGAHFGKGEACEEDVDAMLDFLETVLVLKIMKTLSGVEKQDAEMSFLEHFLLTAPQFYNLHFRLCGSTPYYSWYAAYSSSTLPLFPNTTSHAACSATVGWTKRSASANCPEVRKSYSGSL